jgi:hypothetical protein
MRCEYKDQMKDRRCQNTPLEDGKRCYQHADAYHKSQHEAAKAVGNGRVTRRRVVISFYLYEKEEANGYLDRLRATFTAREGLKVDVKEEVL